MSVWQEDGHTLRMFSSKKHARTYLSVDSRVTNEGELASMVDASSNYGCLFAVAFGLWFVVYGFWLAFQLQVRSVLEIEDWSLRLSDLSDCGLFST